MSHPTDPLEVVWRGTAARLGLRITRSDQVFASTDGYGVLTLGSHDSLDPDDHLAQMILHEICHWIVAGADAIHAIDWGFEPMEGLDWLEFPTIRLQHALCVPHGLTALMAPTTAARAYWDQLADARVPLDDGPDEARIVARTLQALHASRGAPWQPALDQALHASGEIVRITANVADSGPLVPLSPSAPTPGPG